MPTTPSKLDRFLGTGDGEAAGPAENVVGLEVGKAGVAEGGGGGWVGFFDFLVGEGVVGVVKGVVVLVVGEVVEG